MYYDKKRIVKVQESRMIFNNGYDDENYDFKIQIGGRVGHQGRFEVLKKLGKVRSAGGARMHPPLTRAPGGRPAGLLRASRSGVGPLQERPLRR